MAESSETGVGAAFGDADAAAAGTAETVAGVRSTTRGAGARLAGRWRGGRGSTAAGRVSVTITRGRVGAEMEENPGAHRRLFQNGVSAERAGPMLGARKT